MGQQVGDTFTITGLAAEFDVTPRTIRFYEDKGLLAPERAGQNRVYTRRDRARLKLILRGRRVGFSLAVIKEMLDLYDLGDDQEEQVRFTLSRSLERLAELEQQRRDINEIIRELKDSIEGIHQWLAERQSGLAEKPPAGTTDPAIREKQQIGRTS